MNTHYSLFQNIHSGKSSKRGKVVARQVKEHKFSFKKKIKTPQHFNTFVWEFTSYTYLYSLSAPTWYLNADGVNRKHCFFLWKKCSRTPLELQDELFLCQSLVLYFSNTLKKLLSSVRAREVTKFKQ